MYPVTCFTDEKYIVGGNGCCGSKFLNSAFVFFQETGEVRDECYAYILEDITESTKDEIKGMCPSDCEDDDKPIQPGKLKLTGYKILETDEEVMEALEDGPVVTAMTIPDDFFTYKCGIYQSCTNRLLSGHAVELVDYGTYDNIDFWVVKNSWGTEWGEEGYFRIKRGVEYFGVGGYVAPIISSDQPVSNGDAKAAACADEEAEKPNDDMLIVCAAKEAIEALNNDSTIMCPDGSGMAKLLYDSVANAAVQLVEGVSIMVSISADVVGCSEPLMALINTTVFYSPNNTFNLTESSDVQYRPARPDDSASSVIVGSIVTIITMMIIAISMH